MDSAALDKLGFDPIKPDLDRISAIKDLQGIIDEIAKQHTSGLSSPLFGFDLDQDRKQVTRYIAQLSQGGTSLPDRDYYISNSSKMTGIRTAYLSHLRKMFGLIGEDSLLAEKHAAAVLKIETALAKAQNSRTEMRDPLKTYNKFSVNDLGELTPSIDWKSVLQKHELAVSDSLVINNPAFFKSMDILLSVISLEDWKTYLRWYILNNTASLPEHRFCGRRF